MEQAIAEAEAAAKQKGGQLKIWIATAPSTPQRMHDDQLLLWCCRVVQPLLGTRQQQAPKLPTAARDCGASARSVYGEDEIIIEARANVAIAMMAASGSRPSGASEGVVLTDVVDWRAPQDSNL